MDSVQRLEVVNFIEFVDDGHQKKETWTLISESTLNFLSRVGSKSLETEIQIQK